MLCGALLPGCCARPRPSSRRGSSSAPGPRPFAALAVAQRAGNGCGPGLRVLPSTRPTRPGPAAPAPAPGEPAAPLREHLSPGPPRPPRPGNYTCSRGRIEALGSIRISLISHYLQVLIYLLNVCRAPILFQARCQELSIHWCTEDRVPALSELITYQERWA